ncbi:MAG: AAA family ATPase [Xenococcaceae cyanobacterium MO_188.B29]|nr:AAA family ATPase [Xenococcaceae cyanobacterium MO_188.B29]
MSNDQLLESFREAYRNLQLIPLITPEELDRFRVEYGERTIAELEQVVEDCSPTNNKIIFAGHRGCGKSTLLAEFSRRIKDRYFVVFFSIADAIEMSDINHINILYAIAVQMLYVAEIEKIKIKKSIKEAFYRWFSTTHNRITIEDEDRGISGGINFLGLLKTEFKANAKTRNEIKQKFENNFTDLINRIHEIAAVIQDAANQDILVIIDDLDKVDLKVVREIYYENIKSLFQPQFRILFTIPIAAMREIELRRTLETESGNQIRFMSVAKLFSKGVNRNPKAEPFPQVIETFNQILNKRFKPELIEPDISKQIIIKSGGVLREVIRISSLCCSKCLLLIRMDRNRQDIKINSEILAEAIKDIRNDFADPLFNTDYKILKTIYQEFNPAGETEAERQKFLDLLHGLYILEYLNDDKWYDVHPIVADLLQRKGYLL